MKTKLNYAGMLSVVLLFMLSDMKAQKKFKDYVITGSSVFVSGMLDGTIESISYHYENGFKPRVKNANDQFWNPAVSWKNKYKNGDCTQGPKFAGSTTMFASTTDAYHLLRTSKRTLDAFTLVYYVNKTYQNKINPDLTNKEKKHLRKKKWKGVVIDFAILTAMRCAGFHLTYSVLFKRQPNFQN